VRRSASRKESKKELLNPVYIGLLIVGGAVLFILGFATGQKMLTRNEEIPQQSIKTIIFPSHDSETLLDAAFKALSEGRGRDALSLFGKVKELQPALAGIDYLIAKTAFSAGDNPLAKTASQRSVGVKEYVDESAILLAQIQGVMSGLDCLITANPLVKGDIRSKILGQSSMAPDEHLGDSLVPSSQYQVANEEASPLQGITYSSGELVLALHRYAALHPDDAGTYCMLAEIERFQGHYGSASEMFHRALLRCDPTRGWEVISCKEALSRIQDAPASEVPSLSEITSMSASQVMSAALMALRQGDDQDAILFFERAAQLYPSQIFHELLRDASFDEFRKAPILKRFLRHTES